LDTEDPGVEGLETREGVEMSGSPVDLNGEGEADGK
jgi:hypothetical protein